MTCDTMTMHRSGPVDTTIQPPGSKSLTNRALICAALADGPSVLEGGLESEDTQVMVDALRTLGIEVAWDRERCLLEVAGCAGEIPARQADLYVANSGTTMRFLTAMLGATEGQYRIDGIVRMRERPIQDLLDALTALGGQVRSEYDNRCPPVLISSAGLSGGTAVVRGDISSQFSSGLLLAAPSARSPVELRVDGPLVSQPYVHMTIGVMQAFGVQVVDQQLTSFHIPAPTCYAARHYAIEPDASAASYFWAAAAITGGTVTVTGLGPEALQGDVRFCDCLERMGCEVRREQTRITVLAKPLHGIEVDMNDISDTAQTLAAVALFATGPTTITGIAHIRHKETDRIGDLARELRKLGADVSEFPDGLRIDPGPLHGARISTYNDHRMAMSLALVGLGVEGVVIENPRCVEKTYPRFFEDLAAICR